MANQTFNLSLPKELVQQIDRAVKQDMGSRSEYFRRLAIKDLERRQDWDDLFKKSNAKGRAMGITSEQQVYDIIDEYKREKRQKPAKS